MNKDKIIKDLKKRNAKLKNQNELKDIRCCHLEQENQKLKNNKIKDDKLINSLNDFNYKLKQQYELLELNYLRQKKENKELKEKYLNAVADYETTMVENNLLKKQLKKYNNIKEMYESDVVDLEELKNIVLGDDKNGN